MSRFKLFPSCQECYKKFHRACLRSSLWRGSALRAIMGCRRIPGIPPNDHREARMKEKILSRNFCLLFLANFSSAMVMYMLMSTIAAYAGSMGASLSMAGSIAGAYVVGGLISRLFAGRTMDRLGWKKAGMLFLLLQFLSCVGYFLATGIGSLFTVRLIHGLGFGIASNALMTIGMSILPKSRYAEAAGYLMLAPTLAVAVGPFLGGLVYDAGPSGCFTMSALFTLVMMACLALTDIRGIDPCGRKPAGSPRPRGLDGFIEKSALAIALCIMLISAGYSSLMSFYRLYAAETGLTAQFSLFFPIYGCVLLVSRALCGHIQDHWGDDVVCVTGMVTQTLGLASIALFPCMATIAFCAFCTALGYGTLLCACNVIACRNTTVERRSYAVSTFWTFCDAGFGFGPLIMGTAVSLAGFAPMYLLAAALSLSALPLYLAKRSTMRRSG